MNTEEKKKQASKEADKTTVNEKQRHKGKMDQTDNKARETAGKARTRKAGHEAVSDQKSHEYH
jgi:hypothetical protein